MTSTCPQCGATLSPDQTCQDLFNVGQLKEVEQPDYYAVHHLSVPCYMLQHNVYSREGWPVVRNLLRQFIAGEMTPAMVRKQNRSKFDSGQRKWSITKGPKLPGVEDIQWTFTVSDVRLDTAEIYCADVRRWAESVLQDTEPLISMLGKIDA